MLGSIGLGLGSVGTASDEGGGGKAAVVPTLAAVYAAGAATPSVADLMAMASGTTLRFQANTDANALPMVGLYETGASKPLTASGYPAVGLSLATDLSILIGGRLFNWYQMFDPLWNGTFAQLAGYTWHVETCSFQGPAVTAWLRSNAYADRSYSATKNWQPAATPAGPLGSGPGTMLHLVSLYNTLDDSQQPVDQLDGFGQNVRQVSPIRNGVIYETATHYSHRLIVAPAANDGVGWGVWDGNFNHGGDVPRAAWSARTVGASAANDWYLAFSLQDTAGDGQLHDILTLARTGITLAAPVTATASSGLTSFKTVVDLTAVGSTPIVPAQAGKVFVPMAGRFSLEVKTVTGAATVAPTISVGDNGSNDNWVAASALPAIATLNAGAGTFQIFSLPSTTTGNASAAVMFKVSAAVTGPTVATLNLLVQGYYV